MRHSALSGRAAESRSGTHTRAGPAPIALPQVIFVTGKGGTGKSTLAAALALALARRRGATLIDLDGRQTPTVAALVEEESAAGSLIVKSLSARAELQAFIERIVPVKMIARRMLSSRTFGFVTAALPGLEAFLMLERVRLIACESAPDHHVVIDGPASGGALELMSVAGGLKRLAPFGTLHRLAGAIEQFERDPARFAVLVTLRAEELALREALEAVGALRASGIRCAGALLNGASPALFSEAEVARLADYEDLQRLARSRRAAAEAYDWTRRELRNAGLAVVEAPMLYRAELGCTELGMLSDRLAAGLDLR